ncbi:hypothetical protein Tco_1570349 [Tanacetum coccineum]
MAALRYRDEHNKVGYLQKPTGSDDYHQILDFLRASHIRSPELGPPAILATIDETPYTITEESVRSQLQLADDGGIDDLPIAEIYSGMDNLGFLQTILGIETSSTRQYHVFKLSSKLFANMKLNFEGQPMQLLAAMLPQDQEGAGAGVATQAVPPPIPEPMLEPDQPQDHLSTPLRQQTPPISPPSPPRSTQAPSAGTTLKDTKKLFKDVVGKLVKKVKAIEVKLKTKKRKVVVSDSDQEEEGEQDVDLDAVLALANAVVIVDSNIPPGGASSSHIPTDIPPGGASSSHTPTDVPTGVAHAGVSNKGKTPMVEEDITVKERTLKSRWKKIDVGEEATRVYNDKNKLKRHRQKRRAGTEGDNKKFLLASAMTLKRTGPELEEPSSKQQKFTEAPIPSVPDVPQPPVGTSPKSSGTRRKSLGRNRLTKPKSILKELDLDAADKRFIKVVFDEDSTDETPILWSALLDVGR